MQHAFTGRRAALGNVQRITSVSISTALRFRTTSFHTHIYSATVFVQKNLRALIPDEQVRSQAQHWRPPQLHGVGPAARATELQPCIDLGPLGGFQADSGPIIFSGRRYLSKSSSASKRSSRFASRSEMPFSWAVFASFAALS